MKTHFNELVKYIEIEGAESDTYIRTETEGYFELDHLGNESNSFALKIEIGLYIDNVETAVVIEKGIEMFDLITENLLNDGWELIEKNAECKTYLPNSRVLKFTFDKVVRLI